MFSRRRRGGRSPRKLGIAVAVGIWIADRLSKVWAVATCPFQHPIPLLPGLNLYLTTNPAGSFGLGGAGGPEVRWMLIGAALVTTGILYHVLGRLPCHARWQAMGIGMVIGGGLGNAADRWWQAGVIDFIDLYWRNWHWPTFNVADMAICVGMLGLLWSLGDPPQGKRS